MTCVQAEGRRSAVGQLTWIQVGQVVLMGFVRLVSNPLLYVAFVLMAWDLSRNARFERSFFGVRVTKVWFPLLRRLFLALIVGIVFSALVLAAGTVVRQSEIWVVSAFTLLLALIRVRFLAAGYSVGLFIGLTWLSRFIPVAQSESMLGRTVAFFSHVRVDSWLGILACVFLAEAVLLFLYRFQSPAPAVVTSKRGRSIGATVVQLLFIVPLLSVTPGGHALPGWIPSSWPWLGAISHGFDLTGVPFVVGFSGVLLGVPNQQAVRTTARWSLLTGLVLAGDAWIAHRFGFSYGVLGIGIAVLGREIPVLLIRRIENNADPVFAPSTEGVRVLATRDGSLAATMGLLPGEVISHVNQVPVHTNYDLHFAFDQNPAYAKLQVVDARGEVRIVGKPVYSGELNQLGLILAPDQPLSSSYLRQEMGILQTLYLRAGKQLGTMEPIRENSNVEV